MLLSLTNQRNDALELRHASNMARCLIGSRPWRRLKSLLLRCDNRGGGLYRRVGQSAADAIEVGCARSVRRGRSAGEDGAKRFGNFRYKKAADANGADVDCEVQVYPLLVRRQSATWPEAGQRVVQWVDPENAISLIRE
jgi:hypothetical protein